MSAATWVAGSGACASVGGTAGGGWLGGSDGGHVNLGPS